VIPSALPAPVAPASIKKERRCNRAILVLLCLDHFHFRDHEYPTTVSRH
jgi:hypothetical protein